MEITTLKTQRRFADEKMQKVPVFDTEKMFFDQYCLLPGQAQKIHTHAGEDKVYLVFDGEATVHVGGEEQVLREGQAALARAGTAHGVRNATDAPLVVLAVMAPRPD